MVWGEAQERGDECVLQHKPIQYCKVIILQLKIKKKKRI